MTQFRKIVVTNTMLLFTATIVLGGCGVFSSKEDYLAHREVKLAESEQHSMVAKRAYLDRFPKGAWAEEYKNSLKTQEETIYQRSKASFEGLGYYLELYPEGSHVPEAKRRMAALASVQGSKDNAAKFDKDVRKERRENTLETRRTWARATISYWSRVFLNIKRWNQSLSKIAKSNSEFNEAFGKTPKPVCDKTHCLKGYSLDYAIPVPGATRIDKNMAIIIRLQIIKGKLATGQILIPDHGFSRWYELEEQNLITDEDPQARSEATT